MSNRIAVVLGGAGFIGSHTVDALLARGYHVRVVDSLTPKIHPRGKPNYLPSEVEFIQADVLDRVALGAAVRGAECVFHLAAYQDYLPDFSTFLHVNTVSTALLYEVLVEQLEVVKKVVVASSQAAYGEGRYHCPHDGVVYPNLRGKAQLERADWEPRCPLCGGAIASQLTDESHVNPQNAYALSKYSQEMVALALGRRYDMPTVAMRYSIVQGPRQSLYNAYSGACRIFCLSLHFDQPPLVYEDGLQRRDFVNIHDVVDANMLVLDDPRADGQVFNVGGGRAYTVLEFAKLAARVFNKPLQPSLPGLFRFGDTRHIHSDIRKLQDLGWSPRRSAQDSVHEYLSWLQDQEQVEDVLQYAQRHMRHLNVVCEVKG